MRKRELRVGLILFLILLLGFWLVGRRRPQVNKESGFGEIDPYAGWQEFEQDYGIGWGKVRIRYPLNWRRIERSWRGEAVFLGFSPKEGNDYYTKEPMVRFLVEENPSLVEACDFDDELTRGGVVISESEEGFSGRIICEKEIESGGVVRAVTFMPYGKKMVVFVFEKLPKGKDNLRFLDDYLKIVRSFVLE
jgi:hypothetical protein